MIDNDTSPSQRQSNKTGKITFLQRTKLKWKEPDGGPLSEWGGSPPSTQCVLQRYTSTQANITTFWHWHSLFLSAPASPPLSPVGRGVAPLMLPPSSASTRLLNLSLGLAALFPPVPQSLTSPPDLYHKSLPLPPATSAAPWPIVHTLQLTASKSPINPRAGLYIVVE